MSEQMNMHKVIELIQDLRICNDASMYDPEISEAIAYLENEMKKNNLVAGDCMALVIAETPVLTGNDAKRFDEAINNVKPLPKSELDKIRASYNILKNCERKEK